LAWGGFLEASDLFAEVAVGVEVGAGGGVAAAAAVGEGDDDVALAAVVDGAAELLELCVELSEVFGDALGGFGLAAHGW
jgi:hypothetical protein